MSRPVSNPVSGLVLPGGTDLDALLREELGSWPGQAAVAVVTPQGRVSRSGADRRYPWASVTKVLAALTVLDLASDGVVDLDEPAGPPGSSLRHLLSHASGLALEGDQRVLAQPGRRRIYSNAGIELAARFVEERAGRPFAVLMGVRLLSPLGMSRTVLRGSPAHGAVGPVSDLARLAGELLDPHVLDPAVVAAASTTAFPGLAGVLPGFGRQDPNDWGLGCEVRGAKSPHWTAPGASPRTFGHFGQSGSFLWVDPDAGVACVAAGREPFGPWAAEAWPRLSSRVLSLVPGRPYQGA